ncbi:MAG: hypothetical protein LUD02_01555 [Tannerellaceae bacterium]|nr:hypothetical protein [Tannerellaceae bacterium]
MKNTSNGFNRLVESGKTESIENDFILTESEDFLFLLNYPFKMEFFSYYLYEGKYPGKTESDTFFASDNRVYY